MNANPYLVLGVRPFINCCSVRTLHGGSLMLPQVRAAIDAAAEQYVNLDELMAAASERLAALTGAESGIVTCGSAAAVALGTAACVAGNDPAKMLRLPFTEGMVNRVIIPRKQRFAYDQAVRMIGCPIVEIDTRAELDAALEEPVAMVVLLGKHEHLSGVRLEEIASVVTPRGIPILVDAASEHLERPSPWLARGADLVVYSGGKFLRGPQTSGLLLGRRSLVEAAWRNASPHQAFGRPMKVSKEDIVGVLAAVEYWFNERDAAAERQRWFDDVATIAERLRRLPGVEGEILEPEGVERVPRLKITWDRGHFPIDGMGLRQALLDGTPRIMIDDNAAVDQAIVLEPFGLQPGEARAVGDAVVATLGALAGAARPPADAKDPAQIAGDWALAVNFQHGERRHRLSLAQQGALLTGHHHSAEFEGPVEGRLSADRVAFSFEQRFEGSRLSFRFDGNVEGEIMRGTVFLGAASETNHGLVNRSQFGTGAWQASRLA